MSLPQLPRNVSRIAPEEHFTFNCNSGRKCFTRCCRQLELALTPYDVLRLKNALGIDSHTFLEKYVIIEHNPNDAFPRYYLTMVDDGKASCVFLRQDGCSVYKDRPGACRSYPLGRAAFLQDNKDISVAFVLLREEHCLGFSEGLQQTPLSFSGTQGLDHYNRANDALMPLQQHDIIRKGLRLSNEQANLYTLALYDLDSFRQLMQIGAISNASFADGATVDDETLLACNINWLIKTFFPSMKGNNAETHCL